MKWDYDTQEELSATGNGVFHHQRGHVPRWKRLAVVLRSRNEAGGERGFQARQRLQSGRRGAVDDHPRRRGLGRGEQFARHLRHRHQHLQGAGRITNLFVALHALHLRRKAYVTQIWDNRIFIVNPKRYEITGYIECPNMGMQSGSTEQMVQYGKYVFVNCWSYQNRILRIDTETDRVDAELVVGIQPTSLVMDKNHKLWTITDGGYEGSPYGYEARRCTASTPPRSGSKQKFPFQTGRQPFGGADQRHGRQNLLDQRRHLVDERR